MHIEDRKITKAEYIAGNRIFARLVGKGFNATPAYKGGIFENKYAWQGFDNGYRLDYVRHRIYDMTKESVNNPVALFRLIQENLRLDRINKGLAEGYEEIVEWMHHPEIDNSTLATAFTLMCDSFKTREEAYQAQKLYRAFFQSLHYQYNPWAHEKAKKPGYEMIIYLQEKEDFPIVFPEKYELDAISKNKYIKAGNHIIRNKNFFHDKTKN